VRRRSKAAKNFVWAVICLVLAVLLSALFMRAATDSSPDDSAISDAICPIVYPVDETPRDDGYHYIFYGNAFFINKQGYLITAAHVLSAFRNGGGQPYILVGRTHAPAVLQKADLIAADWGHDVAVLRANPNPFDADYKVAFLPLQTRSLVAGTGVVAMALRPVKVQDPHTYQAPVHDRFAGQIVDYQFTQEEKGAGDTELLLFDHEVLRGQSGGPVLAGDTREVVGIVDGRWLRPRAVGLAAILAAEKGKLTQPSGKTDASTTPATTPSASATTPSTPAAASTASRASAESHLGAAVRIHYAVALLREHHIAWQPASQQPTAQQHTTTPNEAQENTEPQSHISIPVPISVVPAPYPPQSLFGGEVILDAQVDTNGKLTDANVIHGDPPFLDKAQAAVQTWSFRPAQLEGQPVGQRIAVAFEFAEPFLPSPKRRTHEYPEPPDTDDRAPLPVYTVEPEYPVNGVAEGSVVVLGIVDEKGQLTSTEVIRDQGSLTGAALSALEQWRFAPARKAGKNVESVVMVVAAFRRPALAAR
jgi:TonB family protein